MPVVQIFAIPQLNDRLSVTIYGLAETTFDSINQQCFLSLSLSHYLFLSFYLFNTICGFLVSDLFLLKGKDIAVINILMMFRKL